MLGYANPGIFSNAVHKPVLFYYFDNLGTVTYRDYQWQVGDRLDVVANKVYRNSKLWWIILEHNPEISDPMNIKAGTILRIPNV